MSVTTDIVESWLRPRVVIRRLLLRGRSEAFALSFLLIFLAFAFVAAAPDLMRQSLSASETSATPRLYGLSLGLLATIPLWYLLAFASHLIARAFGGKGTHYTARLALFWSLLASAPAMLIQSAVLAIAGPGQAATFTAIAVGLAFLRLWFLSLREAEA